LASAEDIVWESLSLTGVPSANVCGWGRPAGAIGDWLAFSCGASTGDCGVGDSWAIERLQVTKRTSAANLMRIQLLHNFPSKEIEALEINRIIYPERGRTQGILENGGVSVRLPSSLAGIPTPVRAWKRAGF